MCTCTCDIHRHTTDTLISLIVNCVQFPMLAKKVDSVNITSPLVKPQRLLELRIWMSFSNPPQRRHRRVVSR